MKIRMVGTGSMIASDNQACYLINDKIMIDMPNGTAKLLKKLELFDCVEYVFITHMHGDHIFDLPFLFLDRYKTDKTLTVVIDSRWYKKVKKLVKLAFPRQYYNIFYNSKIKFISNASSVIVDGLELSSFKVLHGKMNPSYGYSVIENETIVTFTGDSSLCQSIIDKAADSNMFIADCTLLKGNEKHMGVDNIEYLLKQNGNLKIVPSHMGISAKERLKKIKNNNLIIKEDLDEIDI